MAYRVLPSGTIETDTLAEALEVQAALSGKRPPRNRGAGGAVQRLGDNTLNPKVREFLRALIGANLAKGLTTEAAARVLAVQPKGLPPVIRSLNKWCQKQQIVLEKLVTRETAYDAHKKATSIYRFTEEGREFFKNHLEKIASANGTVSTEEGKANQEKTTA